MNVSTKYNVGDKVYGARVDGTYWTIYGPWTIKKVDVKANAQAVEVGVKESVVINYSFTEHTSDWCEEKLHPSAETALAAAEALLPKK